jgi:hypothetical protein
MTAPLATHEHAPGALDASLRFLKRTRWELRELRMVRVWKDRMHVVDVNKDYFELCGVGYPDADVIPLLRIVSAAYDPTTIHDPTGEDYKELLTGRRFPWAHDRVM